MIQVLLSFILFGFTATDNSLKPTGSCEKQLSYEYFQICYSSKHRQAMWTYHELTQESINGPQKRINDYKKDTRLNNPVGSRDYRGSGFDRGHLVPAADMKLNRRSMTDTFYMTNMSPQQSGFNSGIWRVLEAYIRDQVLYFGRAYIITAPILLKNENYDQIRTGVSVPKFYYKIAYYPEAEFMEAYLMPNASQRGKPISDFRVSVNEIEKRTGFDFYPGLKDDLEEELESFAQ